MKKRKKILTVFAIICASLFSVVFPFSGGVPRASANSAQRYWSGVTRTGAIVTGGECPIIVENELLTFDLQELAKNYYEDISEFLAYTGKVTAEYTFYNPSDLDVEATLLFPFGELQYNHFYDENGERIYTPDGEKYEIYVNGEAVEKTVRHTISYAGSGFDLATDLSHISNDFLSDEFFNLDLPVTISKYVISDVDFEKYPAANVAFDLERASDYKVLFDEMDGMRMLGDKMRVCAFINKKEPTFQLIKFGNGEFNPQFRFFKNGDVNDKNELKAGKVSLVHEEALTFKEFALQNRADGCTVSEVDWVNALVCELTSTDKYEEGYPLVEAPEYFKNYVDSFMRWYEYKINVAAGERIINSVTAPIYPSINTNYKPTVFGYTYLLSPASS